MRTVPTMTPYQLSIVLGSFGKICRASDKAGSDSNRERVDLSNDTRAAIAAATERAFERVSARQLANLMLAYTWLDLRPEAAAARATIFAALCRSIPDLTPKDLVNAVKACADLRLAVDSDTWATLSNAIMRAAPEMSARDTAALFRGVAWLNLPISAPLRAAMLAALTRCAPSMLGVEALLALHACAGLAATQEEFAAPGAVDVLPLLRVLAQPDNVQRCSEPQSRKVRTACVIAFACLTLSNHRQPRAGVLQLARA